MESIAARMCGCRVLNAEEKSANSSLAVVLGVPGVCVACP